MPKRPVKPKGKRLPVPEEPKRPKGPPPPTVRARPKRGRVPPPQEEMAEKAAKSAERRAAMLATQPSAEEMAERRRVVHELLSLGMPHHKIKRHVAAQLSIEEEAVGRIIRECTKSYDEAFREQIRHEKAEQLARIRDDAMRLREIARKVANPTLANGQPNPNYDPSVAIRYWATLEKYEHLYAKTAGTLEPIRLKIDGDVRVRESLMAVVANMGPEEMRAAAVRALERRGGTYRDLVDAPAAAE